MAKRSDIQGLRALAVIGVVLFHAGLFLPGGFVGVDIFFVVSGFVITSSLLREHLLSGSIRLHSFYARRFKRLFPALALVVTLTALASSLVLSPLGPQQTAAITGIAAMFSLANVTISLTTGDYFDSAAELNPLLHTWTLSVEEQFYFVFPLAIVLGIFVAKNVAKGAGIILITGTTVSFALTMFTHTPLNIYATEFLGFYSPITRAWEFGVGALIAWWLLMKPPILTLGLARIAYLAGLALIAASFTSISATEHSPGPVTLLPVIGTALMILGGQLTPWGSKDPLGSGAAVKIGDWSYSIYLWHWPFIVITGLLWPDNPSAVALAAVLSVIPAIGSYYLLEQPIRYGHFPTMMKKTLLVGLTLLIPVGVATAVWAGAERLEDRIGSASASQLPMGYELGCHGPDLTGEALQICSFPALGGGVEKGGPNVYLTGDSHAAHFTSGLSAATGSRNQRLEVFTASACPLLDGIQPSFENFETEHCRAWQEKVFGYLEKVEPGVVVLAAADGYWTQDGRVVETNDGREVEGLESGQLLKEGLEAAVAKISSTGHTIILVQTVPRWSGDYDWSLDRCTLRDTLAGCRMEMPLSDALDGSRTVRRIVLEIAEQSSASLVDFSEEICPEGLCETYRSGEWIYRDKSHLTNAYSASLSAHWESVLSSVEDGSLDGSPQ